MSSAFDWAMHSGDAWTRRWRELDAALSNLAPQLHSVLLEHAPRGPFRALDIGCGAGSTSLQLACDRPDAAIVGCDLSPSLVQLAQSRLADHSAVQIQLGDAQAVASGEGPFDLFYSRHGVMFFDDPVEAFRCFRAAARPGAALIFSCFQHWHANPWASELAAAAAGRLLPPPGREGGGFAFAEPTYVGEMLRSAGWSNAEARSAPFCYVAGQGAQATEQALALLTEVGPASRMLGALANEEQGAARDRMRQVIEQHRSGDTIAFPAAAWLWSASADGPTPGV